MTEGKGRKGTEIRSCTLEYEPAPCIGYVHGTESFLLSGVHAMMYRWILWSFRKDPNAEAKADEKFWGLFGAAIKRNSGDLSPKTTAAA